ncbi:bifunctional alpha/beta hydrolase/OsmC family protein [Woodsholea maritima]|uniref:bifunctional alpha/beta hydrolase/OsmC family protein n=1 Tax=Woodsholea maritima TaxID=240237 RepID=UPI0003816CD7|nr:alpha/beta fold hydrolase [Woodsholea maritima]
MPSQKVSFTGAQGDRLDARLDRPAGPVRAYALFAHCFSCSKDIHAAARIAKGLAERGIAVLRFDFTGLGSSEGDFANTNFSSNVEDLIAAANFLRDEYDAPQILIGHSLGGAAVIMAAQHLPQVKAVVTLGAPADADHVTHQFKAQIDEIKDKGSAEVSLEGRRFTIKKQFLEDVSGHNIEAALHELKAAVLIAHAPRDEIVGIENATRLFVAARHPKSFLSLDDGDHLLSRVEDSQHAASVISAWAERYGASNLMDHAPQASRANVGLVAETGQGGYHSFAIVGAHKGFMDEPLSHGGLDGGPNPYDMLKLALAGCTTMTLRMYAERKGWDVGLIRTEVSHEKIEIEGHEGRRDVFTRKISVTQPIEAAIRTKLLEIADKCPVHKTLERGSDVKTGFS